MESVSRARRLTFRPSRARRLMTNCMMRSEPAPGTSPRTGSCAISGTGNGERAMRANAERSRLFMETSGLQAGIAGAGHVHVHQRVQQPHPLAPQLQQVLVVRLLLLQLGHLQLPVEPGDAVFQLARDAGGASIEY